MIQVQLDSFHRVTLHHVFRDVLDVLKPVDIGVALNRLLEKVSDLGNGVPTAVLFLLQLKHGLEVLHAILFYFRSETQDQIQYLTLKRLR